MPNTLNSRWSKEDTVTIQRSSVDTTSNGAGKRVMENLNAVGLVLLNGVGERAELTSFQAKGKTVIDFVWVQVDELKDVVELEVISEEKYRLSDHLFVIVTFLARSNELDLTPLDKGNETRRRWNTKSKGRPDHWNTLQELGDAKHRRKVWDS